MTDTHFFDSLETRTTAQRESEQFELLVGQLRHAKAKAPQYAELLAGIDPEAVTDRSALGKLPVTRKSELSQSQLRDPPFGGYAAAEEDDLLRVFASPGPVFEPQGRREDFWRFARALHAAGFRRGDLIHNTFSYHFTPAGFMVDSGAHALGCTVFAAGTGQTELQVQAIAVLRPRGYIGTPSFLKIILDKAAETGLELSSLAVGAVSGEALPNSLRAEISAAGIEVLQAYATADVGLIAYESSARDGMTLDEDVIVEIVEPGTGNPVSEGEVGEILVTTLCPEYPLIRFATGDLSAVLAGPSPCGRTNQRIRGWMGRADQSTKVRGLFVHPSQVMAISSRHEEIQKARLVVDRENNADTMVLHCEVDAPSDALQEAIVTTIRDVCKLRAGVEFLSDGGLPDDGKVIDDKRPID
jgi:phenylacetate-CoA ligase